MFRYSSVLDQGYNKELEQLIFFNPGQKNALSAIVDSIDVYGEPIIYNDGEQLRVKVKNIDEVQTLFALDEERLAGVLLYSRVSFERLVVIHIAVGEDYTWRGKLASKMLVMNMAQQLREIARRIKGIEKIRMMYGVGRTRDYLIRRITLDQQESEETTAGTAEPPQAVEAGV